MGMGTRCKFSDGLCLQEFLGLIPGITLLFKRGYEALLFAAEVTVVEVLHDNEMCRVKIEKIVSQGAATGFAVGDILLADPNELTSM